MSDPVRARWPSRAGRSGEAPERTQRPARGLRPLGGRSRSEASVPCATLADDGILGDPHAIAHAAAQAPARAGVG